MRISFEEIHDLCIGNDFVLKPGDAMLILLAGSSYRPANRSSSLSRSKGAEKIAAEDLMDFIFSVASVEKYLGNIGEIGHVFEVVGSKWDSVKI